MDSSRLTWFGCRTRDTVELRITLEQVNVGSIYHRTHLGYLVATARAGIHVQLYSHEYSQPWLGAVERSWAAYCKQVRLSARKKPTRAVSSAWYAPPGPTQKLSTDAAPHAVVVTPVFFKLSSCSAYGPPAWPCYPDAGSHVARVQTF